MSSANYGPLAPSTTPAVPAGLSSLDEQEPLQPPPPFSFLGHHSSMTSVDASSNTLYQDTPSALGSEAALNKEGGGELVYPPSSPSRASPVEPTKREKPRWLVVTLGLGVLAIVILAVVLPVYFTVIRKSHNSPSSSTPGAGTPQGTDDGLGHIPEGAPTSGGDGSTITTENGSTFVYNNTFGGYWVQDPKDPYNNTARAQAWSPPLTEKWRWDVDVIRGVNLGGWLVTEPFITPALFERYINSSTPAIDEWTLSLNMANDAEIGGLSALEEHYKTFITEEDFARIAAAGLNWVRLPIPFWAISKFDNEPFLEGVAWKYALKAFAWARKYGLRINLDLHTVPGSQNAYNHSGKKGLINFMYGVMGIANAQRTLNYIRVITEFISQPEYKDLIPIFGVINEARSADIGMSQITSFYLNMYDMVRNITGVGEGNGPFLAVHDGFQPLPKWADFLPGADRMSLDTHPYLCFSNQDTRPLEKQIHRPCSAWAVEQNTSWSQFGLTTAGEWSLSVNDCGLYLNGVGLGSRWEGTYEGYTGPVGNGGCEEWTNWSAWTQDQKDNFRTIALASMDALQNWFFWTWKIGNSLTTGKVESPLWSYSLGLEQGWIPADPREAVGQCGGGSPATPLRPTMTGGPGSGQIPDAVRAEFPWPPATVLPTHDPATLPTYTTTGAIPTLTAPVYSGVPTLDGWANDQDTVPAWAPIEGCTYPDQWAAVNITVPPLCPASSKRRGLRGVPRPRTTRP